MACQDCADCESCKAKAAKRNVLEVARTELVEAIHPDWVIDGNKLVLSLAPHSPDDTSAVTVIPLQGRKFSVRVELDAAARLSSACGRPGMGKVEDYTAFEVAEDILPGFGTVQQKR